jgi:hypothetical protein
MEQWPPMTKIRNTSSSHWCVWMKPESRCLIPFNSFAEYAPEANPHTRKKDVVLDCGTKPVPGPHLVYGFLLGLSSCDGTRLPIGPKAKAR